jgi:hypothetical protein
LTSSYGAYSGDTGLPPINSEITIEGNGHVIRRDSAAPRFRLLAVRNSGNLTLKEVTLSGGDAKYISGGAIYNHGTLTIYDSTLTGNKSNGEGGGAIFNINGGAVAIYDSILTDNQTFPDGGGIWNGSGTLNVTNSTISGNTAHNGGGGIYSIGGEVIVTNSIIQDNTPAGIRFFSGSYASKLLAITNSTISGNIGTGIFIISGSATITNSTISDNSGFYGGGLRNFGAKVSISNSTFSGNSAEFGGGIHNRDELTITNSTITGNTASWGGGLYNASVFYCVYGCYHFYGKATLARTLVSGNYAEEGPETYNRTQYGGEVTVDHFNLFGHSGDAGLIGMGPGVTDIVPPEPLPRIIKIELDDNGGTTLTHALPLGSPAIDRALSAECTLAPTDNIDQRGEPRNMDGNGKPSDRECDIGSFERHPPEFQLFLPISAALTANPP